MALTAQILVKELDKPLRKLRGVDEKLRNKILRQAVTAANKVVQEVAQSLAPISTDPRLIAGLLRVSLTVKTKLYRRNAIAVSIMGPEKNMIRNKRTRTRVLTTFGKRATRLAVIHGGDLAKKQAPSYYAHLAGPRRKETFMEQASEQGAAAATAAFADKVTSGVEAAAK